MMPASTAIAPCPYVIQADTRQPNVTRLPHALIAVMGYETGPGVQWTDADWAWFPLAGKIRLDQTPALELFAVVKPDGGTLADGADIEDLAGTLQTFIPGALNRARHNHHSTAYMSLDNLAAARLAVAQNKVPGVVYHPANFSFSMTDAIAFLEANPDCIGMQFATPESNPRTLVPGTTMTLAEAQCDLSVKRAFWFGSSSPAALAWTE